MSNGRPPRWPCGTGYSDICPHMNKDLTKRISIGSAAREGGMLMGLQAARVLEECFGAIAVRAGRAKGRVMLLIACAKGSPLLRMLCDGHHSNISIWRVQLHLHDLFP